MTPSDLVIEYLDKISLYNNSFEDRDLLDELNTIWYSLSTEEQDYIRVILRKLIV